MVEAIMRLTLSVLALCLMALWPVQVYGQGSTQPAPCDPENNPWMQVTVTLVSCGADDTCPNTHESCVYQFVEYDNYYGTTCSSDYYSYCLGDIVPGIHRMPYPGIQKTPAPKPEYSPITFQSTLKTPIVLVSKMQSEKTCTMLPTRRQSRFYWRHKI
jgi:hypothetical protein